MATHQRRALLRHLGLTLLNHSDVEIREVKDLYGDSKKYAIVKPELVAGKRVSLADPKHIERDYSFAVEGEKLSESYKDYLAHGSTETYIYADAPLRIAGLFTDGSNSFLEYEVDQNCYQWYNRMSPGRVRRYEANVDSSSSAVDLRPWRATTLRELPHATRIALLYAMAERKIASHTLNTRGVINLRNLQKRLVANHGYSVDLARVVPPSVHGVPITGYRRAALGGAGLDGYDYMSLRQQLKELGTLIARKDADPDEFIAKAHALHYSTFTGIIFEAWSRLHPEAAITSCSCGHVDQASRVTTGRGGQTICHTCIEEGIYHLLQDLDQYDDGGYLHGDGHYYSYPEYHFEEDDDVDPDERGSHSAIRNYTTDVRSYLKSDPNIIPSSYGDFLMGVELEVVPENDSNEAADHTLHTLAKGYAILKHDGSLDDGGFEIVTAPRGLKEHIQRFADWKPYSTLRAWDAGCCGTHVHISSQAFTASTLGKFIEFYNSPENDQLIQSIAGRHPCSDEQARSYCQRDGCQPGNPKKTLEDKSTDRYFMVNTSNMTSREAERLGLTSSHATGKSINTVEVRVFRASLKKSRLLAQIEFAHASVMFCRWSSMRELDQKHFLKWLKGMAGVYPNLAKWFGVRANTEVVEARPKARVGADV